MGYIAIHALLTALCKAAPLRPPVPPDPESAALDCAALPELLCPDAPGCD